MSTVINLNDGLIPYIRKQLKDIDKQCEQNMSDGYAQYLQGRREELQRIAQIIGMEEK